MKILKPFAIVSVCTLLWGCDNNSKNTGAPSDTTDADKITRAEPDNTAKNLRDRADTALTPGDQGENEFDRTTTIQVRKALMANDQLSITAKNIKIITVNGKVTLKGPVNTEEERKAIEAAVQQLKVTVDNQLEVKTAN